MIVLNDNGRSYAETVGRLSERVADLRTDPRYRTLARPARPDALPRTAHREGGRRRRSRRSSSSSRTRRRSSRSSRRSGSATSARSTATTTNGSSTPCGTPRGSTGPVLVHVLTEKGKGYAPAETDLEKHLHDTSAFDVATGRSAAAQAAVVDAGVLRRGHRPRLPRGRDLIAITAAMPGSTGLLPLAARPSGPGPRRRHRRAARGRPPRPGWPRRADAAHRGLLDLLRAGLRPGQPRRRPARRTRRLLPSTVPASPATTAPATTASSTSR